MEAALPISAAPDVRVAQPKQVRATAPSVSLPLRFMLTGLVALFFAVGWIIAKPLHPRKPPLQPIRHRRDPSVVLGFICTVVMGAMYQSCRWRWKPNSTASDWRMAFALHVIGFIGMVAMFNIWNETSRALQLRCWRWASAVRLTWPGHLACAVEYRRHRHRCGVA
jgi:hypothetical protein